MSLPISSLARQVLWLVILSSICGLSHAQTPPVAETAKMQGQKLYQKGQHAEAVTVLRQATQQTPQDAEAWYYLALALSQMPDYSQADQAFEKAATLDKNNAVYQAHLANAHLNRQRWDKAKSFADKALNLDKQQPIAHYVKGVVALRDRKYSQALTEIRTTLANSPKFALAYYTKYLILLELAAEEILRHGDDVSDEAKFQARLQPLYQEAAESLAAYLQNNPQAPNAEALREVLVSLKTQGEPFDKDKKIGYPAKEMNSKAVILGKPEPPYTDEARSKGTSGTVILRLFLDADGIVKYIKVIKPLGSGLTQSAIKAARGIQFVPARKGGKPVGQWVQIEYGFNI